MDYKDSGVDVEKGDQFVENIKKKIQKTYNAKVVGGVGGFAALYEVSPEKYLASGTDGVGTKVKLAQKLGIHNTIGIDLVAMCVNDVATTGATPLFFLDYLATGKLDLKVSEEIIEGVVEGCLQSEMALIGGETAEMPGVYSEGVYDLAGFCVGEVLKKDLICGQNINEGDILIGISSSGFHSNGYSLVRKLIQDNELDLARECLTPTRIYVKLIKELKKEFGNSLKGLAHITGSGVYNIPRINETWGYEINNWPTLDEVPKCMKTLAERSKLSRIELMKTFNMGIGLVMLCSKERKNEIFEFLKSKNEKCFPVGYVTKSINYLNVFGNKLI
ncbi:MAG: phosphoribosylformylglycinamidine cyclo-ligase [Bacteriovoracaceae bacterium]